MAVLKRERESIELAQSLMLLSQTKKPVVESLGPAEFECKTCKRKFSSFQALGGHRASHKKPRLEAEEEKGPRRQAKMHECSICGMEFALGQALGGHMRKHRGGVADSNEGVMEKVPVLKRSNSKRVLCLDLDLNLTPLENDLKLLFGNKAPRVDLSFF